MSNTAPTSSTSFGINLDRLPEDRDLAGLHRDVLTVFRRHPAVFIGLPVLLFFPFDVANDLVSSAVADGSELAGLNVFSRIDRLVQLGIGSLVASSLLQALRMVADGETPTMLSALNAGARQWGRILGTTFVTGLLAGLGFLLLLVPGFILSAWWMLAVPATAFEHLDAKAARARSAALVKERGTGRLFLWMLGAGLAWYSVPTAIAGVIGFGTEALELRSWWASSLITGVQSMSQNVVGAGFVVATGMIFLELSGRRALSPAGVDLLGKDGKRVEPPRALGVVGLSIVSAFGGLAVLTVVPLVVLAIWAAVDEPRASRFIADNPAVTTLVDVLWGDAGSDIDNAVDDTVGVGNDGSRGGAPPEKVKVLGIERDPAFSYFLDDNGDVVRTPFAGADQTRLFVATGVKRDDAFIYFLDTDGDIARVPLTAAQRP